MSKSERKIGKTGGGVKIRLKKIFIQWCKSCQEKRMHAVKEEGVVSDNVKIKVTKEDLQLLLTVII